MMNTYVKKLLEEQDKAMENARNKCVEKYGPAVLIDHSSPINDTSNYPICPAYWDSILCWPETPASTVFNQTCPSYIVGFIPSNTASRLCTENGVWFFNKTINSSWTNYTNCFTDVKTTIVLALDSNRTETPTALEKFGPVINFISDLGYTVSLTTLIIAFATMLFIKKLHCARNNLHMHLFASFIMKALIFLLIKSTFVHGVDLNSNFGNHNGSLHFGTNSETNNWECKLMTSFRKYSVTANYSWMLMEGLYLYNLIIRALPVDSSNSIKWYVILGWGLPLIITATWVTARLLMEDILCWTTDENTAIFLISAVPIMVSILINLVLFIRMSMVLYVKPRSPITEDSRSYQKWVKSILTLVPLFGVSYGLLLLLYYLSTMNTILKAIWLICDRLFDSFQGCFVAIILCFLNGEVQSEIKSPLYHLLTFLAKNRCSKHFFPCQKRFISTVVGKSSMCTTMSCSLSNNGVLHHKIRLDSLFEAKQLDDKTKDHGSHNGTKISSHDIARRNLEDERCSQSEPQGQSQSLISEPM